MSAIIEIFQVLSDLFPSSRLLFKPARRSFESHLPDFGRFFSLVDFQKCKGVDCECFPVIFRLVCALVNLNFFQVFVFSIVPFMK